MNWLKWVGIIMVLLLVVGVGVFVYNQGIKRGVTVTTSYFIKKINSLNVHYPSQPPSSEPTIIWLERPPLVEVDSFTHVETLNFKPDSIIIARYPKAIWHVSYNDLSGGLIVETYDAHKFTDNRVGSFSIEGKEKLDYQSSPWKAPIEPKMLTVPFLYTNMSLIASLYPDYAAIGSSNLKPYLGKAEVKLNYGVVIVQRVGISLAAGLGYDKWRTPTFYPLIGLEMRVRILGRY